MKRLAEWLQSAEMRAAFPDPDQRKAAFPQRAQGADLYTLAKVAVATCCKQGEPSVDATIRLLQGPLERHWESQLTEALGTAVARLRELEDEMPTAQIDGLVNRPGRGTEALLVLAFLTVLEEAARAPLPASVQESIGRAVEGLLRDGALSTGLQLDLGREPLVRAAARADLQTMLAGRIQTRRSELEAHVRDFLTSKRARTPARPGDITEAVAGRAASLQDWLTTSARLTGLQTDTWLPQVVDVWAYRWFAVGQFLAGDQAGLEVLRARARDDQRTTLFCRWVDGRTISVRRARAQVDRQVRLALQGDAEKLMSNWPLLESRITRSSDRSVLARAFRRVGLPPYHFNCRTGVEWARAGQ